MKGLAKKAAAIALAALTATSMAVMLAGCAGADGADGTDGADGADGADGISVESVAINENGELIITFSDGTTQNAGSVYPAEQASDEDSIAVLFTNDVHCGFDSSDDGMGLAGFAGYKYAMWQQYGAVTTVDIGDFIQGEAIGTISDGEYPVQLRNFVGYDYGTVGNHEFDYGMDALIGEDGLVAQSDMTYLCCNFIDLQTGEPVFDEYALETYGDITVAYVGIATPETLFKSTPAYFQNEDGEYIYGFCEGNDGQNLYNRVQESVDAAKEAGADYVVTISHLGIEEGSEPYRSTDLIANTTGIDAVLDGHSHSVVESDAVENADGEEVLLSSTGTKFANAGKLVIDTNGTSDTSDDELTTELISAEEVNADPDYSGNVMAYLTELYLNSVEVQYQSLLNEVVGKSSVDLSVSGDDGVRLVRNRETAIGNFCADAYRAVMGADIGLVNGGGIRADIPEGDVTYGDVINVHPYGNMACLVEATGQQILDALELGSMNTMSEASDGTNALGESGGFLQVSGLRYTIDTSVESTVEIADDGSFMSVAGERRVKDVQVLNSETGEYEDIDPEATYTVASHNYMLKQGGDGYTMFGGCNILLDETLIDNQVLINYINDYLGGVIGSQYSATEGRITVE
ncbi:MAG TPA: bifunctional metallophosphatase/5'-nucleotidase [Candidatus Coproplasma stercoripullorum]|uniref:Bifunctional metallophosphatase/5'-nucleotidase n=1 Tax=Candidatus Coproplasma stercoripullorum TaxID=2840751 RepID=A0A9D1AF11_9FIRM|nr:bifunctional metallophosphatase/5'-nucleotidase [Candidatus Coproplasma stercoripullorum]